MPLTAYSQRFAVEMDVRQWMSRIEGQPLDTVDVVNIDARFRPPALQDLRCPSCEAQGAVLVSAGVGRAGRIVSQATFRFQDSLGGDAHDPLCDFAGTNDRSATADGLIDLRASRDPITAIVRRLVCAGLETSAFSPADMRNMRLWFLGQRRDARVRLQLDPRIPPVVGQLYRRRTTTVLPYEPAYFNIPGFDLRAAAEERVLRPYRALLDSLLKSRLIPTADTVDRAVRLLTQSPGADVFDATILAAHFLKAAELAHFIAEAYGPLRKCKKRWFNHVYSEPRPALLALAAVLLFLNDWDVPRAADAFASLASHEPSDEAAGNLIGLNPFAQWHPVGLIKALQESTIAINPNLNIGASVSAELERMKQEHAAWTQVGTRPPRDRA